MNQIAEYAGERLLYVEEEASNPTDAVSNTAQWAQLTARIEAVLKDRSIESKPWHFRKSHYKHGGITHLTMTYRLVNHVRTELEGY